MSSRNYNDENVTKQVFFLFRFDVYQILTVQGLTFLLGVYVWGGGGGRNIFSFCFIDLNLSLSFPLHDTIEK